MPRLSQVPRAKARKDIQEKFDAVFGKDVDPTVTPGSATGTPGNWWTVWAHVPDALNGFSAHSMANASLDAKLREIALVRTGYVIGSQFVYSQHCKAARRNGVEENKITDIPSWWISDAFTPQERAVLAYVDGMVLQQGRVHDKYFAALKKHLSEEDIIHLTYFTGMYMVHATSTKALRLEYDDVPDRIVEIPIPDTKKVQDHTDPSWAKNAALK
jgi:alkylhydroperoxidase family enzyme